MAQPDIGEQLDRLCRAQHIELVEDDLIQLWSAAKVAAEDVFEPLLRFAEHHPTVDLGRPGSLVHFVEQVKDPAYSAILTASIRRRPTMLSLLLLNRLFNGEQNDDARAECVSLMNEASTHPLAGAKELQFARGLVARMRSYG